MIVKIGDVISEYSVRNKFDENIPVYSVTNEKGFCTGYFSKEVASKDKSTYKIVPRGYFAYNPSRINVGSVDWQKYEDRVIVSPLYVVFGVSDRLDRQYLLHYLKSDMMLSFIKEYATGSVRDNLKLADLGKFPINLRPVEEQRQIAATLDKIDELIAKRRQQLDKLDELVKSRFIEMFGDPMTNPYNLPKVILGSVLTIEPQNGLYKPQSDYVSDGTGVPILRIDSFYEGKVSNLSSLKRLICSEIELKRYSLYENDIVINRVNSIEYLGKCGLIQGLVENTVFESNMMRLHVDEHKFHPVYITKLLCSEFIYQQILRRARKAVNQASINQKDVQSFVVYMPPIEQQDQFAAFVKQTDKSKLAIQKSLEKLEILKKALMQKYFG